jgi:hypothetical protein
MGRARRRKINPQAVKKPVGKKSYSYRQLEQVDKLKKITGEEGGQEYSKLLTKQASLA